MNLRPEAAPTFPLPPGEGGPKGQVRERPPGSGVQFGATARPDGLSPLPPQPMPLRSMSTEERVPRSTATHRDVGR